MGTHGGCCLDHVFQRWDDLLPVPGLQATVRVDPDVFTLGVQNLAVHVALQLLDHELNTAPQPLVSQISSIKSWQAWNKDSSIEQNDTADDH